MATGPPSIAAEWSWTGSSTEARVGDRLDAWSISELLDSLVNRSMLTADGGTFRTLETMRQFAEDRIDDGILESTRDQHARYYASFVVEARDGHLGPDERTWSQRFGTAWPNVRAALEWVVERRDTNLALTIVAHLGLPPINHRHIAEIHELSLVAIDLADAAGEPLYTSCVGIAAVGQLNRGNLELGDSLSQRAMATFAAGGVDLDQLALSSRALTLQIMGRTDEAIGMFQQKVEAAADHPTIHAVCMGELAIWQATSLYHAEASAMAAAAISRARQSGSATAIAFALLAQGVATVPTDAATALRLYEESEAVSAGASSAWLDPYRDPMTAHALLDLGRTPEALDLGLGSGRALRRQGNLFLATGALLICARAFDALGDPVTAAQLYAAEGWADRTDHFSTYRRTLRSRLSEALGDGVLDELIERGAHMSTPAALDLAERAAASLGAGTPTAAPGN